MWSAGVIGDGNSATVIFKGHKNQNRPGGPVNQKEGKNTKALVDKFSRMTNRNAGQKAMAADADRVSSNQMSSASRSHLVRS